MIGLERSVLCIPNAEEQSVPLRSVCIVMLGEGERNKQMFAVGADSSA